MCLTWTEWSKKGMDPSSVRGRDLSWALFSLLVFTFQSQDKLNSLELTPVRIVKLPPLHSSSSAGRTAPSSQSPPQPSQVQAPPAASSAQDPGPSCAGNPDSAGALRMDTILEDTSSDSHLAEDGFTTAGASSSATKSSYGDLTEQNPSARDRRRLMRQDRIDTKETDCWEGTGGSLRSRKNQHILNI